MGTKLKENKAGKMETKVYFREQGTLKLKNREHGNTRKIMLGTWEQKENKTGNMGTKAYFGEQGTLQEILLGNTRAILLRTR